MSYERIIYQAVEPGIVKITLNRPERRNAQDHLMLEEIQDAFEQADLDEDVRVILLAGAGRDFSSGHDISGTGEKARGPIIGRALATKLTGLEGHLKKDDYIGTRLGHVLRDVSKPTIAMVQGNCVAAGWLVASMCDLIVASDDAQFSDPLARIGIAGSEILFHPYDMGFRKAKEMLWTGDAISAQEGKELGFVSRVVPRQELEQEALKLARKIASGPPVAASLIKRTINNAWDELGQSSAQRYHLLIHHLSFGSDEATKARQDRVKTMLKK